MAQPRLTDLEKKARGTLQKSRATKPRSLADIDGEIADAHALVASLVFVLQSAQAAVEKDGIQSEVTARDNANRTTVSTKLNPSVRLLLEIPGKIRLARREWVLLNAERDAVMQKEAAATEVDEFDGIA